MAKRLIEMVCTGNNGRSPVAELIARNYLQSVGATSDYDSISSGTMVDVIKSGGFPIKVMSPIIDIAKDRKIYDADEVKKLDEALINGDSQTVETYFNKATKIFSEEETGERDLFLRDLGITGRIKQEKDQTVPRRDVVAVLPMDRKNYLGVLGIYQTSDHSPIISVMSVLATGDPVSEVTNAFGQGPDVYRRRIEQLVDEVPKAVRKIIGA